MKKKSTNLCPCGSGASYSSCCEPYHLGKKKAGTAEQLMRSRYSAFSTKNLEYLTDTWVSQTRPAATEIISGKVIWTNLEVISAENGGKDDKIGFVEFKAQYMEQNTLHTLHERSFFQKENGCWLYHSGNGQTSRKEISRSMACPCGSGKKFKRCCLKELS